jgi:enamine deaminase RidA (YjgF/YER057c/UK114 family)
MNNQITRIDTKETYSEIVVHNNTAYISGQVPWRYENSDFITQTQEVFNLIDLQLAKVNSDKTKILSLRIYMKNPENYDAMNSIFKNWIPNGFAPSRATICNVIFPNPKWQIEVVIIAAID